MITARCGKDCIMKKTLYVSDLDGTLLDRDSWLSDETIAILNELIDSGNVNFTIATARTPATVVEIMEPLKLRLPLVVMNGAATWDNEARRFVSASTMNAETVRKVCGIFEDYGLRPLVYRKAGDRIAVHHYGDLSSQEEYFVSERENLELKDLFLNDINYKDTSDDALLIFAMNEYLLLKSIHNKVVKGCDCSSVCYHDIFDVSSGLMETYAPGTSKAVAVQKLAREIGAERIVVFGDNRNDIPMMQIADYAVAPENAVEEVKAVANEIIEPNYMHSVAHFIRRDCECGK